MEGKATKTPDGGFALRADLAEPYRWASPAVSILQTSQYNAIIEIPLYREQAGIIRPPLLKGSLLINAQITFDVGFLHFVEADLRVSGYVGSTGTVIRRLQLGGSQPIARIPFDNDDTFDRISIEAFLLADGQPQVGNIHISQADISAVLTMWS